jgi:hypothetical protein
MSNPGKNLIAKLLATSWSLDAWLARREPERD